MKLLRKLAVVILALGSVSVAQADLISVDDEVFGSDSITFDDDTGLEWLDMSFSDGLSYNQTLLEIAAGGSLEGWRFATDSEFEGLILNTVGFTPVDYGSFTQYDQMVNLVNLLGSTYTNENPFYTITNPYAYTVGFVDSTGLGYADARMFGWNDYSGGYYRPAADAAWDRSYDFTHPDYLGLPINQQGSFLVHSSTVPLPEPGTLALFVIGLAGMGFARRRKV